MPLLHRVIALVQARLRQARLAAGQWLGSLSPRPEPVLVPIPLRTDDRAGLPAQRSRARHG